MAEEKEEARREGTKEDTKKEAQPKRFSLKFIILGAIVVVLGAGGYFGWNLFLKGKEEGTEISESQPKKKKKKKQDETRIIFPLEAFIVNLLDRTGSGRRYLKVGMELEIGGEEDALILKSNTPQLKDTILLLLSSQTFKDINSLEGKLELKAALVSRINQVLGDAIVNRIYFTEFVVQ